MSKTWNKIKMKLSPNRDGTDRRRERRGSTGSHHLGLVLNLNNNRQNGKTTRKRRRSSILGCFSNVPKEVEPTNMQPSRRQMGDPESPRTPISPLTELQGDQIIRIPQLQMDQIREIGSEISPTAPTCTSQEYHGDREETFTFATTANTPMVKTPAPTDIQDLPEQQPENEKRLSLTDHEVVTNEMNDSTTSPEAVEAITNPISPFPPEELGEDQYDINRIKINAHYIYDKNDSTTTQHIHVITPSATSASSMDWGDRLVHRSGSSGSSAGRHTEDIYEGMYR